MFLPRRRRLAWPGSIRLRRHRSPLHTTTARPGQRQRHRRLQRLVPNSTAPPIRGSGPTARTLRRGGRRARPVAGWSPTGSYCTPSTAIGTPAACAARPVMLRSPTSERRALRAPAWRSVEMTTSGNCDSVVQCPRLMSVCLFLDQCAYHPIETYTPVCTSITPSLFHSQLKTCLFHKSYPRSFTSSSRIASTDFCLDRFFWATRSLILFFHYFSLLGRALD